MELKLKDLLELKEMFLSKNKNSVKEFKIGEKYLILTVTFFFVGTVVSESEKFVSIKNFSWVADTGRFNIAMKDGIQNASNSEIEVAPVEQIFAINKETIVVKSVYAHELPTMSK